MYYVKCMHPEQFIQRKQKSNPPFSVSGHTCLFSHNIPSILSVCAITHKYCLSFWSISSMTELLVGGALQFNMYGAYFSLPISDLRAIMSGTRNWKVYSI